MQAMASTAALPVICAHAEAWAARPVPAAAPVVSEKVAERFASLPFESQDIGGLFADRMQTNVAARLLRIDQQALLAGFTHQDSVGEAARAWEGEHIGKFLEAACHAVRLRDNPDLRRLIDTTARGLIASQGADGYLGTYSIDRRWTSWDVWVHKYNLIGLLSYYEMSGDPAALACCRRMADLLDGTFGDAPGKRDIVKAGEHWGMAATSVLEPMCTLYRFTGGPRYLEFCRYIVRAYDGPDGPRIVTSLLAAGSVYSTANGKAYELLSNLNGLVDLYRLTADETLLTAVLRAWDDIVRHQLYWTGTVSSREHFQPPDRLLALPSSNVGETCATVTWLQLNWRLLRLLGEARFAAQIERTVYNHLLAAQDPHNGDICYYTSLVGRKEYTNAMFCCTSSGPRGIALIPELVWGLEKNAFAIHQYTAGRARFEIDTVPVQVVSKTRFPVDGEIVLTVSPERAVPFTLRLRVPEWVTRFEVQNGSKRVSGKAGQMLDITQTWQPSSTLRVSMDVPTRPLSGGAAYPDYVALQRGPQVLALEKAVNPALPYVQRVGMVDASSSAIAVGHHLYEMEMTVGVPAAASDTLRLEKRKVRFVPFADATDCRVWVARTDRMRRDKPAVSGFRRARLSNEKVNGRALGGGHEAADTAEYLVDENPNTFCTADPRDPSLTSHALGGPKGKRGDPVWFSILLNGPETVSRVVFRHGPLSAAGGWFDTSAEKPYIEVARAPVPLFRRSLFFPLLERADWERVASFETYPATNAAMQPQLAAGQIFEVRLPQPLAAYAIRLAGRPGGDYVSCAELSASPEAR